MGLFNLFSAPASPEPPRRDRQSWSNSLAFSGGVSMPEELRAALMGTTAAKISRELALQVPAVKRARDIICATLGALRPRVVNSQRKTIPWELFDQPEDDKARSVTMTALIEDLFFEGRAWWRILETDSRGWPSKIRHLDFNSVTIRYEGKVYVDRDGNAQGQAFEWVPDDKLIRFDSPNPGILTAGARAIRMALAVMGRAELYVNENMPLGYFTPKDGAPGPGDDTQVAKLLRKWEQQRKNRAWGYVDEELDVKTLTWNPEQMLMREMWDAAVLEISRLVGLDPEELGVSTTTRTYANAEQRRLDLLDFSTLPYVTAVEDRAKMRDVLPSGFRLVYDYAGFLRSDTKTRLEVYKLGQEIGTHSDERIAELEQIPKLEPRQAPEPAAPVVADPNQPTSLQQRRLRKGNAVGFTDHPVMPDVPFTFSEGDTPGMRFGFAAPEGAVGFKADAATRTVSGTLVPWGVVASSGGYRWMFAPGSLHWSSAGRVKLDKDHVWGTEFGAGVDISNAGTGLTGSFRVAKGARGDEMLSLAQDGVYDGFSIEADFASEADGWTEHPEMPGVRLVHSATLRKVALTAMPAYDDARVTTVAANQKGKDTGMTAPAQQPAPFDAQAFMTQFTEGITTAVSKSIADAFAKLPTPQAEDLVPAKDPNAAPVKAGGVEVVREAPVYLMNGHGHSFVRDTWKARTEGDHEAAARVAKFRQQTEDASKRVMLEQQRVQLAATTGNASQIIPPGYRPDMFVTQLMQGRPLVDSFSKGTLSDATPFNIPKYVSSSGMSSQHTEGVNPSGGTLNLGLITVVPTAISGLFELTREIVDSANPAIDAIAMNAMRESYAQQTEALAYAELNGTNGQGGAITSGFVPSGAQVSTTTGQGDELLAGVRAANALYPFRRFGRINRAHLSQEATTAFATAVDTTGRPLLPYVGPQNSVGTSSPNSSGYLVDGQTYEPTWSMTGNAAGDADVLAYNSQDVWAWESGLLMFRFEERNGPAQIDLALYGYFATRILRPVGLMAVRHTAA